MPRIMANGLQSDPVLMPDKIGRRSQAKASFSPTSDFPFGPVIWEVLVKEHGSVKAAAFTMGDTDPSLLRRQILDGTLPIKKLFEADPRALAAFGDFLVEQFGDSKKTKQELAREKLPELLAAFMDALTPEAK